jgi:hypothetical protein
MSELTDPVRRLIAEHIVSVEQLEILLLLRSHAQSWTAQQVAEEIRTSADSAGRRLEDLHKRGFLAREQESPKRYRYSPPAERMPVLEALAAAYSERRFSVIELIFAKPIENLRVYSDAFRLRKEPKDG